MSAEEQVEVLRKEAQRQYSQSVEDLQSALGIQNRTIAVQKLTQNQLLQLESEYNHYKQFGELHVSCYQLLHVQ